MTWFAKFITLGIAATSVLAAPAVRRQDSPIYSLSISCGSNEELDGQPLKMKGSTLGVYGDDYADVKVYATDSTKEGYKTLHTVPVGIVDHTVGVSGDNGLYTFVELTNPDIDRTNRTNTVMWNTFKLEDGKVQNYHADGDAGAWLAFPGSDENSWVVKWSDGSAMMTQDYMAVDVMYKIAEE